jgi:small-conductance mechanosensitive channel
VAAATSGAVKDKPPSCILVEFTDAGMKFSLTFWLPDPTGMDNVKSEVMLSLWDVLRREGIGAPYTVREIRLRGGPLPVEDAPEVAS